MNGNTKTPFPLNGIVFYIKLIKIKVEDVAMLVDKLKNEAKVIS